MPIMIGVLTSMTKGEILDHVVIDFQSGCRYKHEHGVTDVKVGVGIGIQGMMQLEKP